LDQLQTTLFTRPALYRTVALLRSDIVSRDQLQADLDRAHADVNRDLIDLRQDQADAADDDARVHQLQARLGTTVNPATKAHLTTWLRAVQTDMNGDRADLQQDRNEVVAASTTASLFAEQLYQAENAVAAGWRALLMAYISR
jgi:hypothetical protein